MAQTFTGFLNYNVNNAFTFDLLDNTTGCNDSLVQIAQTGDVTLNKGDLRITDGDVSFCNNTIRIVPDSTFSTPTLAVKATGLFNDIPRGLLTGAMLIGPVQLSQSHQYATFSNVPAFSNPVDPLDDSYYRGYKVWMVGESNEVTYQNGNVRLQKTLIVESNVEIDGKLYVQGAEVYENPWKPLSNQTIGYSCNIDIGGRLLVTGASAFASNVAISGDLIVQGLELKPNVPWKIVNAQLIQYDSNVVIGGTLTVQGFEMKPNYPWQVISPELIRYASNVDIQGSLTVDGTEIIGTWKTVDSDTVEYSSNVRIGGTLLVGGSELKPNFPWYGTNAQTIRYDSNVDIGGSLMVSGSELKPNFPWNVINAQTIRYESNVQIQGSLMVQETEIKPNFPWAVINSELIRYTSNVDIGGQLFVQGAEIKGHWQNSNANTIQYASNVSVGGSLNIAGTTTLNSGVTLNGALGVTGALTVGGYEIRPNYPWQIISSQQIRYESNVDIQGTLHVQGAEIKENPWKSVSPQLIRYESNVDIVGTLTVQGASIIDNPWKNIDASTINYDSNVSIGGSLTVNDIEVIPNFPWRVLNPEFIRYDSNVEIGGTLSVGGAAIQANPWVFQTADTLFYTNNVSIGGTLSVDGVDYVPNPWLTRLETDPIVIEEPGDEEEGEDVRQIVYYLGNVAIGSYNTPEPYIFSVTGASLFTSNVIVQGNVLETSDARLKTDLQLIPDALDKVKQLHGYTFLRTDLDAIQSNATTFTQRRHAGMVAQEVEQVLPEVVHHDTNGFKSISYGQCVGLLVEAIKALDRKVDSLIAAQNSQV